MTKLLRQALEAVDRLSPEEQDDIARTILQLTGAGSSEPVGVSDEERRAIERSKAAAQRGDFASEAEVAGVWAKHGL